MAAVPGLVLLRRNWKKVVTMSTTQIEGVLAQMQAVAGAASGSERAAPIGNAAGESTFSGVLKNSLERINALQNLSAEQKRAFQAGEAGVELHEVMIAGQKASIAFEMGVQVRNRLVNAYKDVMNMPV